MAPLELRPLADGRWLLQRRGRRFILPGGLGRRLAAGERIRELDELNNLVDDSPRRFSLTRGLSLLRAPRVMALAKPLVPAVSWPALCLGAVLGLAGLAWGATAHPAGAVDWPVGFGLLALGGLVHELGHATALIRGDGRPGPIGVGLMTVVPVFWCDVSEVVLLGRANRLRVDFAGPLWQLMPAGLLAVAAGVLDSPTALVASRGLLYAAVWSLLPLLRTDGAWALADVLEIAGLEAPAPPAASPTHRRLIAAARVTTAVALAVLVLATPWRMRGRLGVLFGGTMIMDVLALLGLCAVSFFVIDTARRRVASLLRAAIVDLKA